LNSTLIFDFLLFLTNNVKVLNIKKIAEFSSAIYI